MNIFSIYELQKAIFLWRRKDRKKRRHHVADGAISLLLILKLKPFGSCLRLMHSLLKTSNLHGIVCLAVSCFSMLQNYSCFSTLEVTNSSEKRVAQSLVGLRVLCKALILSLFCVGVISGQKPSKLSPGGGLVRNWYGIDSELIRN